MNYKADSIEDYILQIPEDRKANFNKLLKTIKKNIPKGFEEGMIYGMPSFFVPHSKYPKGYHVDPKKPLHFVSIASQKHFIALYHSGIHADKDLYDWFVAEFPKHSKYKPDMGKSCVRFNKIENIPFDLVAELMKKMTVKDWIKQYEKNIKPKK